MPTVFTHPAVAIALYPWLRDRVGGRKALVAGGLLTALPDLDVIGFRLGIPYGHMLGHRGLSHSLAFALVVGGVAALPLARRWVANPWALWLFFFLCLASHGVLDALTSGGKGVAFLAPFSNERFFFDSRPVLVSPIAVDRFLANGRGLDVLLSELRWIWLPALSLAVAGTLAGLRRRKAVRPVPTE